MNKLRNNCTKIINEHTKPRVAYIFNHSYFLGGGEISFYELIESLDQKLYEPVIFVPEKGEIERKLLSHNYSVDIILLPPLKKILLGLPFRAIFRLTRLIKSKNIDLIHVNGSRACLYGCIAGWILNIPVVWHVRETIQDLSVYEALLSSLSKKIICVSKSVQKKRFGKFGRLIKNKTIVIYNGVDTFKFNPDKEIRYRNRKDIDVETEVLFGIIGNIIPLKGHDFFLKGFAKAKETKSGFFAKVLIIGRSLNPDFYQKLHKMVIDLNLTDSVIFREYSNNIVETFSALDIFVLPSKREGFSRSLLEAMSSRLPVLASRISEIEEAVIDGQNAILVDFGDVNKMATAIVDIYTDDNLKKKMGMNNRDRVIENFDLFSHAKAVQNVYKDLLS